MEVHHASFRNALNTRLREVVKRTLRTDAEHHFSVHHSFADPHLIKYAVGSLVRGDDNSVGGFTESIIRRASKLALPTPILSAHTHPMPVSSRYVARPSLDDLVTFSSGRIPLRLIAAVSPRQKKVILLFYREKAVVSLSLKEDVAAGVRAAESQEEVNRLLSTSGYKVFTLTKPRGKVLLTLSEAQQITSHFKLKEIFEENPF